MAPYSFVIAGHTYGETASNHVGLYPPFQAKYNYISSRSGIEMCFLTGDMVRKPSIRVWDEVDVDIDSLKVDVYMVAGNHDLNNKPLYVSRYGRTYFKFTYRNDLFIVLDPIEDNWNISGEQLAFLNTTLDSSAAGSDNIFVFFHQVLWSAGVQEFNHISVNSFEGRALPINF